MSQALRFFRPPSERAASYRAGRWCAPTPRTCSNDGSNKPDCRRTIRLTHFGRPASRIFWKMTALLKPLSALPATPTAVPRNSMTAAGRRFCSRIWRGFGIEGCFAPPEICYLILKGRPIGHAIEWDNVVLYAQYSSTGSSPAGRRRAKRVARLGYKITRICLVPFIGKLYV